MKDRLAKIAEHWKGKCPVPAEEVEEIGAQLRQISINRANFLSVDDDKTIAEFLEVRAANLISRLWAELTLYKEENKTLTQGYRRISGDDAD